MGLGWGYRQRWHHRPSTFPAEAPGLMAQLWVGRGCLDLRGESGRGWEGEAQGSLGAGFLRGGGVVKGAKDWGPEGSTPGGGGGSLEGPG